MAGSNPAMTNSDSQPCDNMAITSEIISPAMSVPQNPARLDDERFGKATGKPAQNENGA